MKSAAQVGSFFAGVVLVGIGTGISGNVKPADFYPSEAQSRPRYANDIRGTAEWREMKHRRAAARFRRGPATGSGA